MSDGVNIISPGSPLLKGRIWRDEKVGVIPLEKGQYRFSLLRAKEQKVCLPNIVLGAEAEV